MSIGTPYTDLKDAATTPRTSGEDDLSLLDLVILLAERKRLIFIVTAVCTILALIASFVLPKRYKSTVIILPPQQSQSIGMEIASQLGGSLSPLAGLASGGLGLKNNNDMYVAMLQSDTVEDGIIHQFGLMREYHIERLSSARKELEHYTTIDGDNKDNLIHISVEDHDPQRAADLANAYVDQFRKLSESLAITEASQRRLFFQKELETAKDNLANAEDALKQTQEKTGMLDLDTQARALIETVAALRAQITAKEVQIQAMSTFATGENSELVEAQQELDSLRAQLAKLGGSESDPNALILPKGRVPEVGLEYLRKLRDVKYNEAIFEILARQFEIAKLDEAKEGSVVQVVDPALKPDHRSFPRRGLMLIAAFVGGFFLGVLIALARAGMARLRTNPEADAKLALLRSQFPGGSH